MTTQATRLPTRFKATTEGLRKAMGDHWVYLPYPTSLNSNYRAVGGRVLLSEKYRAWKKLAAQELQVQKVPRLSGPCALYITLRPPDKRKRDADNPLKSILDCLKSYGVIEDDNNQVVLELTVKWDFGPGPACVVNIVGR